ncbi:GntR family transcriptional repressor for pyruvate dehydrogenase complex [Curtobacterium sp. PhB130]|uniref:FadR/GntR family transcriptional regulator n=1 Tax=unclassified Curtobacterium TaxID=257496 RepID=UPI000F4CFB49|nr:MULTISPECIES: FCD domain-containing protein [unclassified Curtobacterium]ROS71862.1 GntR family transcriptional repressor for pyruvate dehydrogenase complex [Curtobacterium sp. PhB130]TCK58256.1 GntR family transcriptional repressor for pyruvate dehydrogenase complex [Curtobacterium sp. PhB136]
MEISERVTTREELVTILEGQILNGTLAAGTMLASERKLSEQYSVSRSGVREALRVLAERRLIVVRSGRGAFVREPDSTAAAAAVTNALRREQVTARDVIVGRRMLEAETAALAATARTASDLDEMQRALTNLGIRNPLLERVRADLEFHLAVAHASHNPVLETMFRAISGFTAELILRSLSDAEVSEVGLPQHAEILDAIRSGDGVGARTLMCEHLDVAMSRYGLDLDQGLDAVAERQLSEVLGSRRTLGDLLEVGRVGQVQPGANGG